MSALGSLIRKYRPQWGMPRIAIVPPAGRDLLGSYSGWLLAYLLMMVVLWRIGIEAIYRHPTPFYALFAPVLTSLALPVVVVGAMRAAALFGRTLLYPDAPRLTKGRLARWTLFAALCIALLQAGAASQNRTLPAELLVLWQGLRWHLIAIAVFTVAFVLWLRAMQRLAWWDGELDRRQTIRFLAGVVAFLIIYACAIAMLRGGVDGIQHAYSHERHRLEYIGDIGTGGSILGLFGKYDELHPFLSIHAKVHPPGPIAILWMLSHIAGRSPLGLSLATVTFGSFAVVPLYLWVKDMLGQRVALTACLLYALVPSVVLFTATSADTTFMPFALSALFLFWRAVHRRSVVYAVAAGMGYAACSLISFSLLSLGAFFGLVGLWRLLHRAHRVAVVETAFVMGAAFLMTHALVYIVTGFEVVEVFRLSKAQFDADQAALDLYEPRYPSWAFKLMNPLAWLYFAGIPVSILFVRRMLHPERGLRAYLAAMALTLLALDALYLARGEGERSALYVFPFLVIPAAHLLDRLGEERQSLAPLGVTLAFLAFQCWLTETLFYTYW